MTRTRLLRATAESIRAQGLAATTIGGVSAAIGVTHGAFYAHFGSRDELVAAAIQEMFSRSRGAAPSAMLSSRETLAAYVDFYLSQAHRDRLDGTCPIAILAVEAERLSGVARSTFAEGVAHLTEMIRQRFAEAEHPDAEELADSLLAELVGAIALARAEPDPSRSAARLEHSRQSIRRRLGLVERASEGARTGK